MSIRILDCVILEGDLPEHGLRRGDLGTVVETYKTGGLEVEFLTATGDTVAVVTLRESDVRRATPADVVAARSGA